MEQKKRKTLSEWQITLLLLMQVVLAKEDISLMITNFNSSVVELSCHLHYDGNMKNVFFEVSKGREKCLEYNSGNCTYNSTYCDIEFQASEDQKTLSFLVKLKRSCDENIHIECLIYDIPVDLHYRDSIELAAPSDPPVIFVNDSQPIEAGTEKEVPITCTVTNMCNKNKLDISVNTMKTQVDTEHAKEGVRFNTTATVKALFLHARIYTIVCKEIGRDDRYSRSYSLEVHSSKKVNGMKEETKEYENDTLNTILNRTIPGTIHSGTIHSSSIPYFIGSIVMLVILISSVIVFGVCFIRKRNNRREMTIDVLRLETLLNFTADDSFFERLRMEVNKINYLKSKGYGIHLNPMQDQWKVSEELRTVAGRIIKAAYHTLDGCMKSGSVINILLFLTEYNHGDVQDIKKCFERANALMQTANGEATSATPVEAIAITDQAEKQPRELLIRRNYNWLRRSVLHLAVIFCHDEKVLNCIPKELIEEQIDGRDIHGCTPLYVAYMHSNLAAIKFLESRGAKLSPDYFGNFPVSDKFEAVKRMLVSPNENCELIENDLKELFTRMVTNDGLLKNAEIVIGGSGREKLDIAKWNEYDLQICVENRPFGNDRLASSNCHEYLVKRMDDVVNRMGKNGKTRISLRCVSVGDPWIFIWEEEGCGKGQEISVNVVFILVEGEETMNERQASIIQNAPGQPSLSCLRLTDLTSEPSWLKTFCRQEWVILDHLPPGCRLGVIIALVLLKTPGKTSPSKTVTGPLTTAVVKTTLLWILAGETPRKIKNQWGNVIGRRYGALRQKPPFVESGTHWITEEDVKRYAEDGRFWAEKIFDAIEYMARKYKVTLDSFISSQSNELNSQEVGVVLDSCKRCQEWVKPHVFFTEESLASSEWEKYDSGIRTRLQKVIDGLKREARGAEAEPGVVSRTEIARKEELYELENKNQLQMPLLGKGERKCEELKEDIETLLEKLGQANQKELELFRLKGKYEAMEKKDDDILRRERKKEEECNELEEKIDQLRIECKTLLEKLEQDSSSLLSSQTEEQQKSRTDKGRAGGAVGGRASKFVGKNVAETNL